MTYLWCKRRKEWVPKDEFVPEYEESSSAYVVGDIEPYKSMVDGSLITSRSKHRAHLKAHGCIEVGNETQALLNTRPPKRSHDPARKEFIAHLLREKRRA